MKWRLPDDDDPIAPIYGVVIGVAPTDATYEIEFQRAPDSAGSPDTGNAVSLGQRLYAPVGDALVDMLPSDGVYRHYRWRHVVTGGTAGGWTSWVKAAPDELPDEYASTQRQAVLDGVEDGATYFRTTANEKTGAGRGYNALNSSNRLTAGLEGNQNVVSGKLYTEVANPFSLGTVASPATKTKTIRIPFTEILPFDDASKWTVWVPPASLRPNPAIATSQFYYLSSVIPKGATITGLKIRGYRASGGTRKCIGKLLRVNDDETTTTLATSTHAGTGWATTTASCSQLVGDEGYIIEVELNDDTGGGGITGDTRFMWAEVEYTVPDYLTAY